MITTGQQPGLFLGPLYTLYKALSAAALAAVLESRWNRPVVPVFWAANDDHDYAEAQWASWLDASGEVRTGSLPDRPADAPLTPMARLPLPQEVGRTARRARARSSTGPGPGREHGTAPAVLPRRHHVGAAYSGALAEWLAPSGSPASTARTRRQGADGATAGGGSRPREGAGCAAHRRAGELGVARTAGDRPGGAGATLVFLEDGSGRDRLVVEGDGFVSRRSGGPDHTRRTREDRERDAGAALAQRAAPPGGGERAPADGRVRGGPGELAYLAQCEPLYAALRVVPQTPVPRWSGVLVEPRVDRVLDKFGATLEELLAPANALESRVVRLADSRADCSRPARASAPRSIPNTPAILSAAVGVDPTLERPVSAARQHAVSELGEVEKKVQGHLKKREATELAQIARARLAVQPNGKPQERVLAGVSWVARHGVPVLEQVRDAAGAWYRTALAGGEAGS